MPPPSRPWLPCARAIVPAGLLCLLGAAAEGLENDRQFTQYVHTSWGRSEGLPSEVVWDLLESSTGYLWVATDSGLARFDGQRFTVFDSQSHPAFLSNDIRAMAEAPDGTLWVASFGGGLLRLEHGRFTRFGSEAGLVDEVVYDVHVAGDGAVWAATASGACRWREGRFDCWTTADGLAGDRVARLAEDADGALWLATLSGGVSRFDGTAFSSFTGADGLDVPQIFMLTRDPQGGVFFGTYGGTLYHAREGGLAGLDRGTLPEGVVPVSALHDGHGNLWIGTSAAGLWRWRPDAAQLITPHFADEAVWSLLEDSSGSLWVGTSHGLHRFRAGAFLPWGAAEGLADGSFVVAESADGAHTFIGTEGEGLYRLSRDGEVRRFTTQDGLPVNSVSALMVGPGGQLWVGTFGGGVVVLEGLTAVKRFTTANGLPSNQIAAIHRDAGGAVWVGAAGGLSRIFEDQVTHTLTLQDGLPANLIRHIGEDAAGDLWLSSDAGLARFSPRSLTVEQLWTRREGLSTSVVTGTWIDDRGVVWIGSRSRGLARLEDGDLFQFEAEHGIPVQSVMTILEDDDAHLWLAGRSGIARVPRSELDAVARGARSTVHGRLFTQEEGLRSVRVPGGYQPAAVRSTRGELWFATDRGVALVDPARLETSAGAPAVLIEQVRVDGRVVPVDGRGTARDPLTLAPGSGSLEIDYTAPRLTGARRLRFRYRLGDADAAWQSADTRRTAFFTSPGPGPKTFEVSADLAGEADAGGTSASTRLVIYAEPRWYQARWFLTASAAMGIFALLGIYRLALRHHRHRQQSLERLVAERTKALQQALDAVQRLSRTDALTGIANRRHFEHEVAAEWARSVRHRMPISVLMIDIDYFKQYNDVVGHQAGDRCLQEVAKALVDSVRGSDLVARYGGEEFVILLPDTASAGAGEMAARARNGIRALAISHPARGENAVISVSVGYATAEPGVIESPDELIERADQALYHAKRSGRDTVVFDPDARRTAPAFGSPG